MILNLRSSWKRIKDIFYYAQGNKRYAQYNRNKNSLPFHIRAQYEFRLQIMNKECYNQGSCIHCGCICPPLQMASKSCGGNCYPPMMGKEDWIDFRWLGQPFKVDGGYWTYKGYEENTKKLEFHKDKI